MFVVTGGSSGIGQSLALALAKHQKDVLIIGRREDYLKKIANESTFIEYCCADVSTEVGREKIVCALTSVSTVQGLINNAGIIDPIQSMSTIQESDWNHVLATNLNAPLFLSQALLPKLEGARVLNIGSGAAYFPIMGWSAYCVSKAALAMLTRCWQLECQKTAFASVMPGIIDTPMQAVIRHSDSMEEAKQDFFKDLHKGHKLIDTETVALFLTWLLLDVDLKEFCAQEWDIYDTSHHARWLTPPHHVPLLEEE